MLRCMGGGVQHFLISQHVKVLDVDSLFVGGGQHNLH